MADSIDVGFARVLDMVEERFGRRVSTVLIALVSLSVALFCLHIIFDYMLEPTYRLVEAVIKNRSNLTNFAENYLYLDGFTASKISGFVAATASMMFTAYLTTRAYVAIRSLDKLKTEQEEARAKLREILLALDPNKRLDFYVDENGNIMRRQSSTNPPAEPPPSPEPPASPSGR